HHQASARMCRDPRMPSRGEEEEEESRRSQTCLRLPARRRDLARADRPPPARQPAFGGAAGAGRRGAVARQAGKGEEDPLAPTSDGGRLRALLRRQRRRRHPFPGLPRLPVQHGRNTDRRAQPPKATSGAGVLRGRRHVCGDVLAGCLLLQQGNEVGVCPGGYDRARRRQLQQGRRLGGQLLSCRPGCEVLPWWRCGDSLSPYG
ncbi:unnamed protein product, partial [Prorocentrum cordatum]